MWTELQNSENGWTANAFAELANQCNNIPMKRELFMAVVALAVGLSFVGSAQAQQTPGSSGPGAPAPVGQTRPSLEPGSAGKPAQTPATDATSPSVFKSDKERDSYAVGLNFGRDIKKQPVELDPASLERGLKDALEGKKPLVTDAEIQASMKELQAEATKNISEGNMKEGEAFLAANKTKDGVVALPSGLQYKIITAGTGAKPTASDTVVCNYRGTFPNGTEFDSSYKRGQPATFAVGGVIKGWTEALQLMPVGSKWQLFIPSELAYGSRGAGGAIGPNQALVFEVELISIKGQQQQPAIPASH
jgi:FKBP-type peptidyl-prolyl cis-trans isomerase FklB